MNFGTAKDEIRQAINIVDLIGSYLEIRRQGSGYVARCPWHDDSRPSLQVNPARQIWKCWVCNIGGDIFSFVMKKDGLDFREALTMLAERAGIELKQFAPAKPVTPGSPEDKVALLQAVAWAENQFHEFFLRSPEAEVARHYIEDRGITRESIDKFRIGYCPDNWSWLLDRARNTQHSPAVLEAAGLVSKGDRGYYDFYKGRVIFPIRDTQKRPIAFGGRILPGVDKEKAGGKYKNSRETKLFSKSEQLYALDIAKEPAAKSRNLTVVEGYTDVIMCHQYGIQDVVACLGTALGDRHIPVVRRFADSVTLLLDGDDAGQRRTNDIIELFATATIDLRVLTLPEELDPADFLLKYGTEPFRRLLKEQSIDALEHKIRTETRDLDVARDTHRASVALEGILALLARGAAAGGQDTKSLRTQQILARLSRQFLLNEEDIRSRYIDLVRNAKLPTRTIPAVPSSSVETEKPRPEFKLSAISFYERELLEILAAHHELACTVLSELGEFDLQSDATKVIFRIYRQLEEAGESLDFNRVLAETEDPQLKSLLVQIVDIADQKARKAHIDPPSRLRDLLTRIYRGHERRIVQEREQFMLENDKQGTKEAENEVHNALLENFKAKLRQQGIIAPTEG